MAEGKKKIMFYADWIEHFNDLTDEEAGRLIKHIMAYVNDLNPEAPDRLTSLLFKPFKQQFKRDLKKWEHKSAQAKAAVEARWSKEKSETIRTNTDVSKPIRKNTVKDKDKVKDKVNKRELPAREDFIAYCLGKKPDVDPIHAGLKYDSWVENDWKDGNDKPIKNWKAKANNTIPHLKTKEKKSTGGYREDSFY